MEMDSGLSCVKGVWTPSTCVDRSCAEPPSDPFAAVGGCRTGYTAPLSASEAPDVCQRGSSMLNSYYACAPSTCREGAAQECLGGGTGSECKLFCPRGKHPSQETGKCENGEWAPMVASCEPDTCGSPPAVDFALKSGCSGMTCPLMCDNGYKKTGDYSCVKGEWTRPACVPEVFLGTNDPVEADFKIRNQTWAGSAEILRNVTGAALFQNRQAKADLPRWWLQQSAVRVPVAFRTVGFAGRRVLALPGVIIGPTGGKVPSSTRCRPRPAVISSASSVMASS